MKLLLLSATVTSLFACTTEREVEAGMVNASLIKIDVVNRYPDLHQKMLTWRAADNVLYVTYEPMSTNVSVGATRWVMVRK